MGDPLVTVGWVLLIVAALAVFAVAVYDTRNEPDSIVRDELEPGGHVRLQPPPADADIDEMVAELKRVPLDPERDPDRDGSAT